MLIPDNIVTGILHRQLYPICEETNESTHLEQGTPTPQIEESTSAFSPRSEGAQQEEVNKMKEEINALKTRNTELEDTVRSLQISNANLQKIFYKTYNNSPEAAYTVSRSNTHQNGVIIG